MTKKKIAVSHTPKLTTRDVAGQIRREFWSKFDAALGPGRASKQQYLDELGELSADVEGRIDAIEMEIAEEAE